MNVLRYLNNNLIFYGFVLSFVLYTLGTFFLYAFKIKIENNICSLFAKFSIALFGMSLMASTLFAYFISINSIIVVVLLSLYFYTKKTNSEFNLYSARRKSLLSYQKRKVFE